jgi:hypothetical protein
MLARHQAAANHPGDPAYPTNPDDALADAFDPDKDKNGVVDGKQLDRDNDEVADAVDNAPQDATATAPLADVPRYAFFKTAGAGMLINDLGTALLRNSTWKGGSLLGLQGLGSGDSDTAMGLNNSDVIVGQMQRTLSEPGAPNMLTTGNCYWPGRSAGKKWVEGMVGNKMYYGIGSAANFHHGYLSDDGQFACSSVFVTQRDGHGYWERPADSPIDPLDAWQLPLDAAAKCIPIDRAGSDIGIAGSAGALKWGQRGNPEVEPGVIGMVYDGDTLLESSFVPANVVADTRNPHLLFAMAANDGGSYFSLNGGPWTPGGTYNHAIDIARDGSAVGYNQPGLSLPIMINLKWQDITRTAPGLPEIWRTDESSHLVDTSLNGWVLASRAADLENPNDDESGIMLPIKIEGTATTGSPREITGVDEISVRVENPDFGAPDGGKPVKDRLWVMAPVGGATQFTLKAPLNAETALELSGTGLKFNGAAKATLNQATNSITVTATDPAQSGQDVPLTLKFGDNESLSKPIGVKIMKARTVKVTVHPLGSIVGTNSSSAPSPIPEKTALEKYLNDTCEPQLNVKFSVTIAPLRNLEWDTANSSEYEPGNPVRPGNGHLDWVQNGMRSEENKINTLRDGGADINIYLLTKAKLNRLEAKNAGGIVGYGRENRGFARREENIIFMDADVSLVDQALQRDPVEQQYSTMAHEIGHLFVGDGHPDQNQGPAPLKGLQPESAVSERLMVSADKALVHRGRRLVKGEWDAAETWLENRQLGDK